jgi:beta-lactamase regulating signal transducer with metallopeptidase domain
MAPHTWRLQLESGGTGMSAAPIRIGGMWLEGKRAGIPGTTSMLLIALGVYLGVMFVRLAGLFAARQSLRVLLSNRSLLRNTHLNARAKRFSLGMPVRISASSGIATPIVVGRRELCLPWRVLNRLSHDELDAVLAHEIAHLRRSDGAWLWAMLLLERILWIQPLNRLAVSRLHTLAECFCDDWALRRSVTPVALASALARVAEWMRVSPASGVVVGMASSESLAVTRVRRILDTDRARTHEPRKLVAVAMVIALLAGMTAIAPGFAAAAVAPYTITAHDDGGPFTVTMHDGNVIGATMDGMPVAQARIHRIDDRVIIDAFGSAGRLELKLKPDGGISWLSRPPRQASRQ